MKKLLSKKKSTKKIVRDEYEILKDYTPAVIEKLSYYLERRNISWLCRTYLEGMNPAVLTRLINEPEKRPLSPFVLKKLLQANIIRIEDLLGGKSISDIPDEHKILLIRLALTDEFILKLSAFPNLRKVEDLLDDALNHLR